jgi:hypothetical protein
LRVAPAGLAPGGYRERDKKGQGKKAGVRTIMKRIAPRFVCSRLKKLTGGAANKHHLRFIGRPR